MKVAICDDDECFVSSLANYCRRFEQESGIPIRVVAYTNSCQLLRYIQKEKNIDLYILDVIMKNPNGIQLAKEIRMYDSQGKIVFLSSSINYAPQGYEIKVSRYWLKPLNYQKFSRSLLELYKEIRREIKAYLIEDLSTYMEKVYFDDIIYIETCDRKTCIHKTGGFYCSTRKMIEYEKILDDRFYRCHSAYIVNMSCIEKIDNYTIYLDNQDIVYISKARKKKFISALKSYFLNNI